MHLGNNEDKLIDKNSEKSFNTKESDLLTEFPEYYYAYAKHYRYTLSITIILLTILIGPVFLNWPPLRNLFEKSGAYNTECENPNNLVDVVCADKTTALENLGGFSASVYFTSSFFAGLILDCVGPKITTMFGLILNCLGWTLVAFSGTDFNGFKSGMFFVACSTDCMFMGLLSIANLFPGYASTVLALLGSARSISFAIPLVMEALSKSLSLFAISMIYVSIGVILFVLAFFYIPYKAFPKLPISAKLDYVEGSNKVCVKKYVNQIPKFSWETFKKSAWAQYKDLSEHVLTKKFVAFIIVVIIALLRNNYFTETTRTHLPNAENFYSAVNPMSFIPCPLLGYIADKFSATFVCAVIASSGIISLVLVMIRGIAAEYISTIFNWVYISFIASQCYCYIAFLYPQHVLGKLVGVCFLFAGVVSFVSNAMNQFTKKSNTSLIIMDSVVVALGFISLLILIWLYVTFERVFRQKFKNKEIKYDSNESLEKI